MMTFSDVMGGNTVLQNVGILPHHYTASQPTRSQFETLSGVMFICSLHKTHNERLSFGPFHLPDYSTDLGEILVLKVNPKS
jgi:hypothetical protein